MSARNDNILMLRESSSAAETRAELRLFTELRISRRANATCSNDILANKPSSKYAHADEFADWQLGVPQHCPPAPPPSPSIGGHTINGIGYTERKDGVYISMCVYERRC